MFFHKRACLCRTESCGLKSADDDDDELSLLNILLFFEELCLKYDIARGLQCDSLEIERPVSISGLFI